MNQLARIWTSLSRSQQISLILVPAVVCAVAFGLLRWKHDSDFRVLYSGLALEDASAVTQKIREAGIEFRLDETGSTVRVPSGRLADARLALAGAGLPRTGRIGFELFDRTNLGASDFAEQVNYRRALEGELERTVATLSEVDQARIHITFAKESVFLDARQPSKATVVLRLKHNAQLSQPSVLAVANLVASAVDGLSPEAVAIIDSNGRLLSRPRVQGDGDEQLAEANLEYRRQVESELLAKINQSLGALLGPDRFHASVNVDCDFSSSEENEETVDSTRSAVLTSQTTEESSGAGIA
ncbi:MAG TPA: flagellar basal-body MS-ring/collar protein FliF, partial [Bryobacteraceae bacterium]